MSLDDMLSKRALVVCFSLTAGTLGCGDEAQAAKIDGSVASDAGHDGGAARDADVQTAQDAAEDRHDAGSQEDAASIEGGVDATASEGPTVARGDPSHTYWDLRVRGVGLDAFEGKVVVVRLGRIEEPSERIAAGSARIVKGAFELFFPQAWEAGLYKLKLGYIDANGNGRCDPEQDMLFGDARAAQTDVLEVRADVSMPTVTDFGRTWDADMDCAALNEPWPLP